MKLNKINLGTKSYSQGRKITQKNKNKQQNALNFEPKGVQKFNIIKQKKKVMDMFYKTIKHTGEISTTLKNK